MGLGNFSYDQYFKKTGIQYSNLENYPDPSGNSFTVRYSELVGSTAQSYTTTLDKKYKIKANDDLSIVPGSIHGTLDGIQIIDRLGVLYKDFGGETESVVAVGTVDYSARVLTITDSSISDDVSNLSFDITHCTGTGGADVTTGIFFRTPGSPVTSGSLSIKAVLPNGTQTTGSSDFSGNISGDYMDGYIEFDTGIVRLEFGEWVPDDATSQGQDWYHLDNVDGGNVWKPISVDASTILIGCVITSYLPLDAGLLRLDPVRLPQDGRVPIFRDGQVICIHNSQSYTVPDDPILASTTYSVGRSPVSLLEMYDDNGVYVPETAGYSIDLDAGEVTTDVDVSDINTSYNGPFTILHRIEDMKLASDVQITGHISITSGLTYDYPADTSYVSTVLPMGDLQAKVTNMFDQESWTGWADTVDVGVGGIDGASYNWITYPIQVNNTDTTQERWALRFTSSTDFNIVGEHLGTVGTGNTSGDVAPTNPATGNPYFTMEWEGFGSGWSSGDVIRFNTWAANYPIWFGRTTLQGAPTEFEDNFIAQPRGDSR